MNNLFGCFFAWSLLIKTLLCAISFGMLPFEFERIIPRNIPHHALVEMNPTNQLKIAGNGVSLRFKNPLPVINENLNPISMQLASPVIQTAKPK